MHLYFDTETTGIPNPRLPWNHESQPRIISLAYVALDEKWNELEYYHSLVKPDGWEIDEEGKAFAAHKITTARCEELGSSIRGVLTILAIAMHTYARLYAYNINFDLDMLRIECDKADLPWPNFPPQYDLLPMAKVACQLPPTDKMKAAKRFGFKPPKLSEALKILCNEDFPDAHDALADVRASIKIHQKLEEIAG